MRFHLVAFEKFGRKIKPHGNEWKYSFQRLMIPLYAQKFFQVICCLYWRDISNGQQ
jgi:predicted SprT family Zn-dependent metalloprotease